MKKEYYAVVADILKKRYSEEQILELQTNASSTHEYLKDNATFEEWIADFCLDQIQELFEEYEVDFE